MLNAFLKSSFGSEQPNSMIHDDTSPQADVPRLSRRLERERRARMEAEAIAERGLRQLYEKQEEISLLENVAEAANMASTVQDAMRYALERICAYTKWPIGHALLAKPHPNEPDVELVSAGIWHLRDRIRFAGFRDFSEKMTFASGIGLPGRILETGKPAWIKDVTEDANFPRSEQARQAGLKAAFGCPVLIGTEVAAVLEFFAEETLSPDEGMLKVMAHIGTQLGRVVERRRAEERLIHGALHDPLTNLPNRAYFLERLQFSANRAKRQNNYHFAVLFLDLDRFKIINDSLGHLAGDQLIVEIARRLTACLRRTDLVARNEEEDAKASPLPNGDETIARLGGDEFTILLEDIHDNSDPVRVAERIQIALNKPFVLAGQEVVTTVSIGIALSTTGYTLAQDILRDADIAMYRAKSLGKDRYEVFDQAMHASVVARLQLEGDLRRALERHEFRLYYQPIVSLASKKIQGFEALVRWQHPERGIVPPIEFVPVAEETGLILFLGRWVLREACRQMQRWQKDYPQTSGLTMSINLSAKELAQADLVDQIAKILQETGVTSSAIRLELTESAAMENAERTRQLLVELKQLGIRLSIDDFGTGYSSLSYLRRFPIDTLKIDRSFISHIDGHEENRQIVKTIMLLAANLGMEVIAEGAETSQEIDHLTKLHCEYVQGFYFFAPLDGSAVESLFSRHKDMGTGPSSPIKAA
jgi:predicted signal transduction protein with EAL and GGDEF domain